ncbi:MAG: hypothetical protein JW860_12055, partial [Sedimentisphaerales bacterium]|nr:hypothetical protein [Sedimentisphaerales bacterium]
ATVKSGYWHFKSLFLIQKQPFEILLTLASSLLIYDFGRKVVIAMSETNETKTKGDPLNHSDSPVISAEDNLQGKNKELPSSHEEEERFFSSPELAEETTEVTQTPDKEKKHSGNSQEDTTQVQDDDIFW